MLKSDRLKTPAACARCSRNGFHLSQASTLESRVVVAIEIVGADNPITALQQAPAESGTDEAGSIGEKHRPGTLTTHAWPSPMRQNFRPAAATAAGSNTERASNTQAG